MRLIPTRALILVAVSALLQLAAFPIAGPVPSWRAALCWVALVPLLVALLQPDRSGKSLSLKSSFLLGYLCGILWYLANCYWIFQTMHLYGGLPYPVSVVILLLFALYLGLYHAFFAVLLAMLRASSWGIRGALLLAPFAWVAVELARARVTFFPWDLLGYAQVDNLLLTRMAPIAGVMGISFVIAALNAAMAWFFFAGNRSRVFGPAAALVVALGLQLSAGAGARRAGDSPTATAVLLQENLEVGALSKEQEPLGVVQEVGTFAALSVHPSPGLGTGHAAVIVWPEAPSHLESDDPIFRTLVGQLARTADAPVIAGSLGIDRDPAAARGYRRYDSASLFTRGGAYFGRYDKIHLVPWGEFIPYKQFFSFADKLTEGVGDMDRGNKRSVFVTNGHNYGVFVCYESIFGDEVREFAKNGAEVLVNISDDGWYGDSGAPWQHLNMARMRAIENHRWLLRSTNTGITTAIDPLGRVATQAPRHMRGAFSFGFGFEPAGDLTFYTRYGDWFAWLCGLVTLLAVLWSAARSSSISSVGA